MRRWTIALLAAACLTRPALAADPIGYTAPDGVNTVPVSTTNPLPVSVQGGGAGVATSPAQRTIVALDASIVATGGAAVTALNAGHRTAGGFLQNPVGASTALCINEQGTASGTTSGGATTCVQPGQSYTLTPAAGAVSVISSDSSHPFSGYGLQ